MCVNDVPVASTSEIVSRESDVIKIERKMCYLAFIAHENFNGKICVL
jgi:hypothetical protein